jgi:hypothetical protein
MQYLVYFTAVHIKILLGMLKEAAGNGVQCVLFLRFTEEKKVCGF